MASDRKMHRGLQQALYKYLPGCWADFTQSGGGTNYAVHVDNWNSVQLVGINNKRLLRIVGQHVKAFQERSPDGEASVVGFPSEINEEYMDILTPKVSDLTAAIQTSVNPLVFICKKCGRVRQYYDYDDFRRHEHERCCGENMTQLKMIRVCKCGYADGIFVPRCKTPGHGTQYVVRKGSGLDFICKKCNQRIALPHYCPECKRELKIKTALDSSNFIPFSCVVIDLLDKQKDVFLETEQDGKGEKVVLAQYLKLLSQEKYKEIIKNGKVTQSEEFEEELQKKAEAYRANGLDEVTIYNVLNAERKMNPNNEVTEAISRVSAGISVTSPGELKSIAEEILEYDELKHAKITLSLEEAEKDAELVNDGIRPNYRQTCEQMGFSNIQICSAVPIVFSSYGYTRLEQQGEGVKLHGFPPEMKKRNIYATRLETEGVLFELDRRKILAWMINNRFIQENDLPADMSDEGIKMWFLDRIHTNLILPFTEIGDEEDSYITKCIYTLIHSLAHILIHEASEICGLEKSSLSEYILPNIPAFFIYCSNSQGFHMGALYSAFQTQLDKWLKRACERSKKCIFDPVCINKEKACAGCLFLNEVSCRHFNKDLDRSYLCGYFDEKNQSKLIGYWEN